MSIHEQEGSDVEEEKKVASDDDEVIPDMNFVYRSIIEYTKFYRRDNGMVQYNQSKNFPRSNIATKSKSFASEREAAVSIYNVYGKNWKNYIVSKDHSKVIHEKKKKIKKREARKNRDGGTEQFVVDEDEPLEYFEGSDSDEDVVDLHETVDTSYEETSTRVVNNSVISRGKSNVQSSSNVVTETRRRVVNNSVPSRILRNVESKSSFSGLIRKRERKSRFLEIFGELENAPDGLSESRKLEIARAAEEELEKQREEKERLIALKFAKRHSFRKSSTSNDLGQLKKSSGNNLKTQSLNVQSSDNASIRTSTLKDLRNEHPLSLSKVNPPIISCSKAAVKTLNEV
jgi:hypothetical protein